MAIQFYARQANHAGSARADNSRRTLPSATDGAGILDARDSGSQAGQLGICHANLSRQRPAQRRQNHGLSTKPRRCQFSAWHALSKMAVGPRRDLTANHSKAYLARSSVESIVGSGQYPAKETRTTSLRVYKGRSTKAVRKC